MKSRSPCYNQDYRISELHEDNGKPHAREDRKLDIFLVPAGFSGVCV